MKERFPRVTWYTCSPAGVLAVADPVMAVQYDTRFDSKAVAPRAQQFFYQYCPEDENQGACVRACVHCRAVCLIVWLCPGGMVVQQIRRVSQRGSFPLLLLLLFKQQRTAVLLKVMAPSTTTAHAATQKPGTAPANTLLSYPIKITALDPVFVVGVSVKGVWRFDGRSRGWLVLDGRGTARTILTDALPPNPPTASQQTNSQGRRGPDLQGRGGGLRVQLRDGQQVDVLVAAARRRVLAHGRLRRLAVGARHLGAWRALLSF